jgi:LysR substrate binding domain
LLQAATSGFGVAIGPHPLVADDIAAGRLVAPFGLVPHGLSMYVSYPKSRATDPQLIAFRNWLLEAGGTSRPWGPGVGGAVGPQRMASAGLASGTSRTYSSPRKAADEFAPALHSTAATHRRFPRRGHVLQYFPFFL